MIDRPLPLPGVIAKWELPAVLLVAWLVFASITIYHGSIGLSSDALNHHIYLGWVADAPRFNKDFIAVSYQAYQYPYIYWPVYKLAVGGASGVVTGLVLDTLQLLAVPPVWMMARACMPRQDWLDFSLRLLSVLLAFSTAVVLMMFDATSNDLLAAIPLVWAMAFAVERLRTHSRYFSDLQTLFLSGIFAGISVAFKLSNGPLAIALPVIWMWAAGSVRQKISNIAWAGMALITSFALVYGYWGWQLWRHFDNPFYPYYEGPLTVLREALRQHP